MSSETGNFSVTVVNGLEEPVTVGIEAETGTDDAEKGELARSLGEIVAVHERFGTAAPRVYTITVTAIDEAGIFSPVARPDDARCAGSVPGVARTPIVKLAERQAQEIVVLLATALPPAL